LISLEVHNSYGPNVYALLCTGHQNQRWIWNATDGTVKSESSGQHLTVPLELEVWAGPLSGGSQAVVLLNRSDNDNEQITVKWSDIGFPVDHSAAVRDLWAHRDLGVFTGNYTSPNIVSHGAMMLNITLTK
jgi:hypothetical protein